ncbi:uncharacterized protein LOC130643849 [Hydractinia symbiolongicarpus]|uniref:uncharacterized protein LOC130643849 n=1 Tax=Hydractinia symbiolongicarpus TaxID=13093 RepID=UPI00254A0001|nr:uncharacterized protein LOC130643849 [Hydractinia symbiolongicarpus]
MLPSTFEELLPIGRSIKKKTSFYEKPPAVIKVDINLALLGNRKVPSLSFNFRIGRSTVTSIFSEVPQKIWKTLSPVSVKMPATEASWKSLAKDFWTLWGYLLCIGAIDGKHCVIICPQKPGSSYYNYKGSFSIVLMAIADTSYMFTYVNVENYGRQSDVGVYGCSNFGKALLSKKLVTPDGDNLPKTNLHAKYCFIGDEAFPLKENMQ